MTVERTHASLPKASSFVKWRQGVFDASWQLRPWSRTAALSVLRSHSCGGSSGGLCSSNSSDVLQQRVRTIGESLPQRWKFALFLSSGTDSVILYTCTTVFGPNKVHTSSASVRTVVIEKKVSAEHAVTSRASQNTIV